MIPAVKKNKPKKTLKKFTFSEVVNDFINIPIDIKHEIGKTIGMFHEMPLQIKTMAFVNMLLRDITSTHPDFATKYLALSTQNLQEGRWYTLLTSSFTQLNFEGISLFFFPYSPFVLKKLGTPLFSLFIFTSALIPNIVTLILSNQPQMDSIQGFCGLACSIYVVYATGNPKKKKDNVHIQKTVCTFMLANVLISFGQMGLYNYSEIGRSYFRDSSRSFPAEENIVGFLWGFLFLHILRKTKQIDF